MSQSQNQPVRNRLPVIATFVFLALFFVMIIVSAVLGKKLQQSEDARIALEKEIAHRDALAAQEPYVPRNHDLFTARSQTYLDIDGDGQEERVSVVDRRAPKSASTRLTATFSDGKWEHIEYDDYYDSFFMAGDLSGNGTVDILLVLAIIGSNHGVIEYKTLHFEDGQWKEYPDTFLSNPKIKELQPADYGRSFFCIDATIIADKDGNFLRTVWHDANDGDLEGYKVYCVDASCRKDGWYVENVQVIDDYYAPGIRESVIPSRF